MRRLACIPKPVLLAALAFLWLPPAPAGAEPVAHLGWNDCGASGIATRMFACNTNSGGEELVPWTTELFTFVEFNAAAQEIRAAVNLNHGQEHPLDPGVEYYGLRLTINHAKSTGSGACEGCSMPAGIYLSRLWMYQGAEETFEFPLPEVEYVNWQCDGSPIVDQGSVTGWQFANCATPTQGRTWGQIKFLYR